MVEIITKQSINHEFKQTSECIFLIWRWFLSCTSLTNQLKLFASVTIVLLGNISSIRLSKVSQIMKNSSLNESYSNQQASDVTIYTHKTDRHYILYDTNRYV